MKCPFCMHDILEGANTCASCGAMEGVGKPGVTREALARGASVFLRLGLGLMVPLILGLLLSIDFLIVLGFVCFIAGLVCLMKSARHFVDSRESAQWYRAA